jgi:hypothetical protein
LRRRLEREHVIKLARLTGRAETVRPKIGGCRVTAAAAANRGHPAVRKSSAASAKSRHKAVVWSILSAVGGATLLFIGQVAIEEYKSSRATKTQAAETRLQQRQQQDERLDTLFNEYVALGVTPERAGEYVDTGGGGSRDDLSVVVRHLRKVIAYVVAGRLDLTGVAPLYGGRLAFWRDRLGQLGSRESPASRDFSESELREFRVLANALRSLNAPLSADADSSIPIAERQNITLENAQHMPIPRRVNHQRAVDDGEPHPLNESDRRAFLERVRASGLEVPQSTLDAVLEGQVLPTAAGGPNAQREPPGIRLSADPPSALQRVLERQSSAEPKR